MKEQLTEIKLSSASVTDRGLSEKRPLNEDSFLADQERRIFAVADGVGGAEAGEVASRTAVEVLDEAFRHHKPDDDIEDLMEIAIQRANASIHQMSREHPKLSMMATTIVALHLDPYRRHATIGHVGDSRLYRLAPDGRLYRETEDHSVVEEEMRAGRITPEQAANHPNRNIISRALGAEAVVEADMKTIEVEEGTTFLLCSDGITRHNPDDELQTLLASETDLDAVCDELKKRCYQRGAEDNLTAVLIRVGEIPARMATFNDDEKTIPAQSPALAKTISDDEFKTAALPASSSNAASSSNDGGAFVKPASAAPQPVQAFERARVETVSETRKPSGSGALSTVTRLLGVLLFVTAASALAFYLGMQYERSQVEPAVSPAAASPTPFQQPTPVANDSNRLRYEEQRRKVDEAPAEMARSMASEKAGLPLESDDPQFLYLYGRAVLATGDRTNATQAFRRSLDRIKRLRSQQPNSLKSDSLIASTEAALNSNDPTALENASKSLDELNQDAASAATP